MTVSPELKMRKKTGFTLIEIILAIFLLGLLAVMVLPKFIDIRDSALNAAELGVAAAVQGGLNLYRAESEVNERTPLYPAELDNANIGGSSTDNPFFTAVLSSAVTQGWTKQAALSYIGPTGKTYAYNSQTGLFEASTTLPDITNLQQVNEVSKTIISRQSVK